MADPKLISLLSLPEDILLYLVNFLANIEDFHSLSCVNRQLHNQLSNTSSRTILALAAESDIKFFRPVIDGGTPLDLFLKQRNTNDAFSDTTNDSSDVDDCRETYRMLPIRPPYLVIAATARQLSAWALMCPENIRTLRDAFRQGIVALCDLCLQHCKLTMAEIRSLHAYHESTIIPVIDLIDKCSGGQWRETPHYKDGGVSDPEEFGIDATETFYNLAIYGSLFASSFDAFLRPGNGANALPIEARLDYIKYCVPDFDCEFAQYRSTDAPRNAAGGLHDWIAVEFDPVYERIEDWQDWTSPQIALRHLLRSSRWRRAWQTVRAKVGGDFEEEWKQRLWESVVMFQGFEGMEMIGKNKLGEWEENLRKWRSEIEELHQEPKILTVGDDKIGLLKVLTPEYPYLKGELQVTTYGYYWPEKNGVFRDGCYVSFS